MEASVARESCKPIALFVCSSAKKVRDAPACSNAAQKKITKKATIKMTQMRCFSIFVRLLSEMINPGAAMDNEKMNEPTIP